jgi:formylglycine-generating enzyme required for sulfatase activity
VDVEGGNFDTKPVVCIDWYLLNAFCIWDGGRLPTYAEFLSAFYGGASPRHFPWGNAPTGNQHVWLLPGLTDDQKIAQLNSATVFDYMVTGMFNRAGYTYGNYTRYPGDRGTHVAPPGSKPRGAGAFGHMDLAGNVMELLLDSDPGAWGYPNLANWRNITKPWPVTTDCAYANPKPADCQRDWDDGGTRVLAGGSWEGHYAYGGAAGAHPVGFTYHAIGGRCARN